MRVDSSYTPLPANTEDSDPIAKQVALDQFQTYSRKEADRKFINEYAKTGAALGFEIGCGLTIWGIPLATTFAKAQGKGKEARKARRQIPLLRILCAPPAIIGGLGAAIGTGIGAAIGALKLSKKNRLPHG